MVYLRHHFIVLYFFSTSNHNTCQSCLDDSSIVLYFFSTSNHNDDAAAFATMKIVLYFFSTSNHNSSYLLGISNKLSYTSFLHQTTTIPWSVQHRLHCLILLFYIKPHPRMSGRKLSYTSFLHQTTTSVLFLSARIYCLILLFYIKPQLEA